MRLCAVLLLLIVLVAVPASAQDAPLPLQAGGMELNTTLDAFGLEQLVLEGTITNMGDEAYANVSLYAELYDSSGDIIGEGFGFLVDQCGSAILDNPLQPGQLRAFSMPIDLYESGIEPDSISVIPDGEPVEPEPLPDLPAMPAVRPVSGQEVVSVEWIDENQLLYGNGCDQDVFTTYDWMQYDLNSDTSTALDAHPDEQYVTDAMIRQTGITQLTQSREIDPRLFDRSFLTFPAQARRVVYQNDLNIVFTSERDGSFKRVVHEGLHPYSLQGYVWTPLGNFLAYYFGAYGEPVRWFTASADGQLISGLLWSSVTTPSVIVPGPVYDGRRAIIGGSFPDATGALVTGYYLKSAVADSGELMYAVDELPGNNYPAPAYRLTEDQRRFAYIVRPVDGQATLECYDFQSQQPYTLTQLPLQLATDERAWTWLSPAGDWLALGANGDHGGLWMVNLASFEECR